MKIVRPGGTEFNLILTHFCEKYCTLNENELEAVRSIQKQYVDWTYKTSGYYDKDIEIKDAYLYPEDYTDNLVKYVEKMIESLRGADLVCCLELDWKIDNNHILLKYIPDIENKYNIKINPDNISVQFTISHIINKKVLVISSFKEQIDQQISSGNVFKIQPKLEKSQFITYKFPYTFLNNGPDQNSLETLERIQNDIKENYNDFDIAILACGSYGTFLTDFIHRELKKDAIYVGGQLPLIFGIIGQRDKWAIKRLYNNDTTYLINGIPEEFKPKGWEKIEDGCYW